MLDDRNSRSMWLVVAFLFFVLSPSLMAQTSATGALTGTVKDPSGAVVPNVTVTITNTGTNQSRGTTTGSDGAYRFGLLSPGAYNVKFEAAGFSVVEVPSITINVTETPVLDQTLQVGAQSQEVHVQGETETVQTTSSTVGTLIAGQTASAVPLTTRNYTNLLGLSAGANAGVYNASLLGRGTTDIAVNGSSTTENNYQMDGASLMMMSGSGTAADAGGYAGIAILNPDAIQEFNIQTSTYDAGYGRNPGAVVNVVTKSGTNAFHGTVFEFFRNTDLNANDFFRKISPPINGVPNDGRQVLDQNQFGGVFGGPIKKDKFFFFLSYQETRQRNGIAPQGYSVPTLAPIPTGDRSNTAAFQAALGATFCPANKVTGGNTSVGGVQVACNGSNINPVAINLLELKNPDGSYYVPSSTTGLYQNTTFSIPAPYTEHQFASSADYLINGKNTLSAHFMYSTDPATVSFNCSTNPGTTTAPGACVPNTTALTQYTNDDAVLKLTTVVTNNLVNEARLSLQYAQVFIGHPPTFTNSQVGIASVIPTRNELDNIVLTGLFTFGTNYILHVNKWTVDWEAADQISWSHGRHTVRGGFEFERDRLDWNTGGVAIGTLTFQTFQDFLLGLPGCAPGTSPAVCTASAGLTNGTFSSNISNSGANTTTTGPNGLSQAQRSLAASAFVQDDIKVYSRLTLNLGLRWEYDGAAYSKYGDHTNVWTSLVNTVPIPGSTPATGTLAGFVVPANYQPQNYPAPPVGGIFQSGHDINSESNPSLTNFAPRVGFAWQPTASNRFVVRSGFGVFYDRLVGSTTGSNATIDPPYANSLFKSGAANWNSSFAQPYPQSALGTGWTPDVRWVDFVGLGGSNLNEYMLSENYPTPYSLSWNLNLQDEFVPGWVLELGYVGSRGVHQPTGGLQINEAQLAGNPLGTNTIVAPGIAAGLVTTNTVANASLRVPYLGFAPGGMPTSTVAEDTKFNSFQATLRKPLSRGVTLQAAYSFSRDFSTGTLLSNDPNNSRQQYGPDSSYRPQRLAISYDWDIPSGGREGFLGKALNGWSVAGVTIVQDGTPLTITDTRGGTIFGFGPGAPVTSRAQFAVGMGNANVATPGGVAARLGGSILGGPGYLNKAAFGTTPVIGNGTGYGNSGVGILLGPGQFNWDMSLIKTTKVGGLREDATLTFRAEFFNAFNHPQFNNPAVVDVSKSTFGQITSASVNPRLIQFALKYAF